MHVSVPGFIFILPVYEEQYLDLSPWSSSGSTMHGLGEQCLLIGILCKLHQIYKPSKSRATVEAEQAQYSCKIQVHRVKAVACCANFDANRLKGLHHRTPACNVLLCMQDTVQSACSCALRNSSSLGMHAAPDVCGEGLHDALVSVRFACYCGRRLLFDCQCNVELFLQGCS